MEKTALITGITGQDGSYLAELLLHKGYVVHGIIRRASTFNTGRIDRIYRDPHVEGTRLFLHYADLTDSASIHRVINAVAPDEIYHLGAQSHVRHSFDIPEYTGDATGLGTSRLLEAMRDIVPNCRFYQASSSEMFGASPPPQNELTPFYPRSPYGAAKLYAYWMAVNYREAYGLHVSNGILFNHESPRRGETFVTRKVTRWLGQYLNSKTPPTHLFMGNLEARRDWGYAPEYVMAMWLMLQKDQPGDYVIGTGETHTVKEFVQEAFACAGSWAWENYVKTDQRYYRPTEVDVLKADGRKAAAQLGWYPKTAFNQLVRIMVDADVNSKEEDLTAIWDRKYDTNK